MSLLIFIMFVVQLKMITLIILSALFFQSQAYFESLPEVVEDSFKRNKLVPDVLSTAPSEFVQVAYHDGSIVFLGNELDVTSVTFQPKRVHWEAEPDVCYTLAFVDPDAPSNENPLLRNVKHWLVVNIKGTDLCTGVEVASYMSPSPPPGSGDHRYTYVVLEQPGCMNFDDDILEGNLDRYNFDLEEFIRKYNLKPFAGNFFLSKTL